MGGMYYRPDDAIIPMIGFIYKSIRLMFSYDVTTSSLKQYNNGNGAWEFSIIRPVIIQNIMETRHQSLCPSFKN